MWGKGREGATAFALLSASFQSLPLLPTITLGPSGAASRMGGLCTFQAPVGLSNELSCEAGSFSCCHLNLHRCFHSEVWGFISLPWNSGLSGLSPGPPAAASPTLLHNPPPHWVCQPPPCRESSLPSCLSPLLLPVWVSVSSLSPWLLDFHTVRFSVSSGCFLFLNCCPSFGCARRHSVSTYVSILAGSPTSPFLDVVLTH